MYKPLQLAAASMLLGATAASADNGARLDVEFDTPVASIAPRTATRLVNLPSLTFVVRAAASCPEAQSAESISISIADTRISVQPNSDEVVEQTIRVSGKQLGPVAVEEFCLAAELKDERQDTAEPLVTNDALTAQMSLRCVGENAESIQYDTAVLSVALQCARPETEQTPSPVSAAQP